MSEEKESRAPVLGDEVKEIIERGLQKGFLTYEEMNSLLPDDAVSPEYIDEILLALDQKGIDLIDESALEEGEAPGEGAEEEAPVAAEEEEEEEVEIAGGGEQVDDPVRMYLTQMGEIPLLSREEEIALAKRIEITRKRFRKQILQFLPCIDECVNTLEEVQLGDVPFDRNLNVAAVPDLEKDALEIGRAHV